MILQRRGFTLIEVLVVLVIVAIITAVAVIAFGSFGRGRREQIIAEQFVRTMTVAQQQAILTPSVLGLGITPAGYQFYQLTLSSDGKKYHWVSLQRDALSHPDAFKNVFRAEVTAIATAESHAHNNEQTATPHILFLPSGFVTPFSLQLTGVKKYAEITVKNNGVAVLHIEKLEEPTKVAGF